MMNMNKRSYLSVLIVALLLALSVVTAWGRANIPPIIQYEQTRKELAAFSRGGAIFSATSNEVQQGIEQTSETFIPLVYGVNPHVYSKDVDYIGHIGGSTYAVEVEGDYAYIGEGASLTILDISDPNQPVLVGSTKMLPDIVQAVTVLGDYAYLADGDGGLRVIDVSYPANPIEVGSLNLPGKANELEVLGDFAYVTASSEGLRVIDISDPTKPREISYVIIWDYSLDVAVLGNYAYVVVIEEGEKGDSVSFLKVIDVSDPANPYSITHIFTQDANSVTVEGSYAYLTDGGGLRAIDISSPYNPSEVGHLGTIGYAINVALAGDYAYLAAYDNGLRVIDISDPTNPNEIGYYESSQRTYDVAVTGGHAYIVGGKEGGLQIIGVSEPENPTEVGFYNTPGVLQDVVVVGDHAYLTFYFGFGIINISTPDHPIPVGSYLLPNQGFCCSLYGLAVAESYAYIADYYNYELLVIDVSIPADPHQVGFSYISGPPRDVAVAGNYAYVAVDEDGGLHIVDISDPADPFKVSETGWFQAFEVAVAGDYAYIAAGSDCPVIDISAPLNPVEVGHFNTHCSAIDVTSAGDYAYVVGYHSYFSSGLWVINVADPKIPIVEGFTETYQGFGVISGSGYVYLAAGENGIRVIDVSDPANPTEVGFYDTPGRALNVDVMGSFVFVADEENGLVILNYTGIKDASYTNITNVDPDPTLVGEPFTVTYQVDADFGIPSGAVTVTVEGEAVGCSGELAGGMGSCEITLNVPGTHTLTATYSGDDYFLPSSGNEEHTVIQTESTNLITSDDSGSLLVVLPSNASISGISAKIPDISKRELKIPTR